MSDAQFIPKLVQIAGNSTTLDMAQRQAATAIKEFDGENYPSDSCAITQSKLFQSAGIGIPNTYQALAFVNMLQEKRGWKPVPRGEKLMPGDLGTTCFGGVPHHGIDHVYIVVRPMNPNENLIADNQSDEPHFRYVDGQGGKSPTTMFLRA